MQVAQYILKQKIAENGKKKKAVTSFVYWEMPVLIEEICLDQCLRFL